MQLRERTTKFICIDSTHALAKDGYRFIKNRSELCNTDVFQVHLMGKKIVCMTGEEAAKVFYDPEHFKRYGATPKWVQKTLFGENGVQSLDGDAHVHRKQMFLNLTTLENQEKLSKLAKKKWEASTTRWESRDRIVLFEELNIMLCQVACRFAGVPLSIRETKERADDFAKMINAFGSLGSRNMKGRTARSRTEDWIRGMIENVRDGKLAAKPDTALSIIANHKELDGSLLEAQTAAVELINIIRPIVAISTFITFAALALHEHPYYKDKLQSNDPHDLEMFAQEVRRYYPFGPFVGAIVRKDFIWNQFQFKEGALVMLDMYGTNHDERIWKNPEIFYPERFKDWNGGLFNFIPQGGGDSSITHRCPGEGFTVELMKIALDFLVNKLDYQVPIQDLSYSLSKMPTLPKSGFIITNIKVIKPSL